jgi:hypothetical protein
MPHYAILEQAERSNLKGTGLLAILHPASILGVPLSGQEMQDDFEEADHIAEDFLTHRTLLAALPGGRSLIDHWGSAPTFHDAIVQEMRLRTSGDSFLQLWLPDSAAGIVVTFELSTILDLNLDFFQGNILYELLLRRPTLRPDRVNYFRDAPVTTDLEFGLDSTWGVDGFLVARGVKVRWDYA